MTDKRIERLGKRIKSLRKSKGMTLMELEKITGNSNSYLSQIETGNRNIGLEMLLNLTDAFGVGVEFLLNSSDPDFKDYVGENSETYTTKEEIRKEIKRLQGDLKSM